MTVAFGTQTPVDAADPLLLDAHGVRLTRSRLEARGRTYPLAQVRTVRAHGEAPRLMRPVLALFGAALVLPSLLWVFHLLRGGLGDYLEVSLVGTALVVFASLARILMAHDTWYLVLELPDGEARAYASGDRELVDFLVTLVRRLIDVRQPEGGPSSAPPDAR
jgi:hypothetical protein